MDRLTMRQSTTKMLLWCIILSLGPILGYAQRFPSEIWHEGKVVLLKGDTLRGQLKYQIERDIVELVTHKSEPPMALTSRKILYFEIFDVLVNRFRYFYALPASLTGSYRVPRLFEVLHEGRLSLLAREMIVVQNNPANANFWNGGGFTRKILTHDYYFLYDNGEIKKFEGKKKELLQQMKRKAPLVDAYIKENKLKYDRMNDLTRIVAYYNSLYNSKG